MNLQATLTVYTKEKGVALNDLYGVFFEDLNHAADGGLYAELVQNRSFEFNPIDNPGYHALTAWEKIERGGGKAEIHVEESNPLNARNPHYLVIDVLEPGNGAGIVNSGYNTGIPLKQGQNYKFSCYARRDFNWNTPLQIILESADGATYGEAAILVKASGWVKYEATLTADTTDYNGRLAIITKGQGKLYLDMVSLFPEKTFKNRPNGMREDIARMIADMKPKFVRFPGGCLVHDGSLEPDARDSMYRWKNTLGDVAQRSARRNGWRYNQTFGLGYYEYFLFCEDIGAKPLPVLPAGYDPHHRRIIPIEELQPWIDDALDLIEFANGDISTPWGVRRAELGHPEPFGLEYLAIGNEEVGEPFFERYTHFHRAVKGKYPEIKIINTSGPFAAGGEYERGWKSAQENKSDLVDEHYYQTPEWFLANYHRYDNFKADEPKVFLGEYASWGNTYYNALVEAAYMTGLEKNVHAVGMACYAPLLCNADYVNWKPDMIWFNNHEVYGTANYYVQKLFMNHQGDHLLKVQANGFVPCKPRKGEPITGKISVAGDKTAARFYEIKLQNNDTGEMKLYNDVLTDTESGLVELGETDWENYSLSLKARKGGGIKGFIISYGEKEPQNRLFWEIGGWQNQDSLVSARVNGRNSCLTQSLFTVEANREYRLDLEVAGRHIRTYIDGELINDTEDKLLEIEQLYYSASAESSTGDVIIKVVNVQEQPVAAQVVLDGMKKKSIMGKIYEMSGYELNNENSFEYPQLVVVKQKKFSLDSHIFDYEFPKHSITVFRFTKIQKSEN
ncbi:MAG TPA: alpha-L-arabinofuranosidase C-terminal domain-containing protein [Bacillota bacterium]